MLFCFSEEVLVALFEDKVAKEHRLAQHKDQAKVACYRFFLETI